MTNKYLEKIAAHYNLRPHSMDELVYGMNSVSLNDAELNKYHKAKEDATPPSRVLKHVGVGAAAGLGTGAAYLSAFPGLRRYAAPVLGTGGVLGGAAGALYHKIKGGQEKHANVNRHENLVAFGKAMEDPKNRNIIDASKIGIGAAYGGGAGFFANEYMHSRRVNKFMNTITPGNIAKATPSQLLDAVEGLDRIGAGKVPKPKLGRVGAVIGGGVMLGKVLHDRFTKKANYEENEMTNKYLEKVAADHTLKGLVSPAWQEHAIAKEHGKKGPGAVESVVGDVAGRVRQSFNTGSGIVGGAAKGLTAGAILGGLGGAALMMKGHRGLPLSKAIKTQAAGEMAGMMGATGAVIGGVKGGYNGLMDTVKQHAKEVHHEYSTGAIDKHRKDVNNMAKEQYHKHMVEGYPTKSEINNMALKQYALHNKQASEKWIQGAIKHPGALHKALGVPADEKIPAAKLEAAAKKGGKIGREARLAETLKGLRHGKK